MSRFAPSFAALGALLLTTSSGFAQATKPNIILILMDDLGYGDVGAFWQDSKSKAVKKFDTPALDKMAAEGVKLTDHYVSAPVCAPSRASLVTGRHQGHANVRDSQFDKALEDNHTLGTVLKAAGYSTAWVGKAGVGGESCRRQTMPCMSDQQLLGMGSMNLPAHPMKRGFDRFFGYHFHVDGHEHYPQNGATDKQALIYDQYQQVNNASLDLYTTDAFTAAAKQVIIDEATDGDQQPFFLYLAYDTPHYKMQRPAVAYPPLDNDGDPKTGGIQWTLAADPSGKVRYASTATGTGVPDGFTHPSIPAGWADSEKQHVGMILRADEAIADILQTLKDVGIDENTLVVFTSDNGPHDEGNNPRTFESFANFEGHKRDMLEGGIRVPTIARWPKHIPASGDETKIRELAFPSGTWDWLPTFAGAAGVTAPAFADGVSLLPSLTEQGMQRDKGYLYFEWQGGGTTANWVEFKNHAGDPRGEMQTIRVGKHVGVRTAITSGTEDFRIYDVTIDPAQGNNLAASLPDLQATMKALAVNGRRPGGGVNRPYDGLALPAVTAPANLKPGVRFKTYDSTLPWVPEYRDMLPKVVSSAPNFDAPVHAPTPNSGVLYKGFIKVAAAGDYTFSVKSDSGASLHIHDAHVIDDDFGHNGQAVSGSVKLAPGHHPYRLYYRREAAAPALTLEWSGPMVASQSVPESVLFYDADTDTNDVLAGDMPPAGGAGGVPNGNGGASDPALGGSPGTPAVGGASATGGVNGGGAPPGPGAGGSGIGIGGGTDTTSPNSKAASEGGCACKLTAAPAANNSAWWLLLGFLPFARRKWAYRGRNQL